MNYTKKLKSTGNSVYSIVTEKIINQLNEGVVPWHKPWLAHRAINFVSRKSYRGLNAMLLPSSGEYLSFKQATDVGGYVRKGSSSELITFYKQIGNDTDTIDETDETTSTNSTRAKKVFRFYNVFHISNCEGIKSKLTQTQENPPADIPKGNRLFIDYCKREKIAVNMNELNEMSRYRTSIDTIELPPLNKFESAEAFYSTVFHEVGHSTGTANRLARKIEEVTQGTPEYAQEELVAELTAAFICAELNIAIQQTEKQHASYCEYWTKFLGSKERAIVTASGRARKAADFVFGIVEKE